MPKTPRVGMTVLYVLPDFSERKGEIRPAIVVQVFTTELDPKHSYGPGLSNIVVFKGQSDDLPPNSFAQIAGRYEDAVVALGSVRYSEDKLPGTWHFMPEDE